MGFELHLMTPAELQRWSKDALVVEEFWDRLREVTKSRPVEAPLARMLAESGSLPHLEQVESMSDEDLARLNAAALARP